MNSLPLRVISAVTALLLLGLTYYFFNLTGLIVFGFIFCFIGAIEFQKLAFAALNISNLVQYWFLAVCLLLMLLILFSGVTTPSAWGVVISTYFVGTLWLLRGQIDNQKLHSYLSLSALGFIYCALFPMYALKLLQLPLGHFWFILLIAVVFFGDIFAFFGGSLFGKEKLMPNLSPSKTIAGAISGTIGSVLAGLFVGYFGLKAVPITYLIAISLAASVLAQNGDLFESLLKRIASVKDSGNIMPGHGGVLDRLDGVYFAAPLIYSAALALSA